MEPGPNHDDPHTTVRRPEVTTALDQLERRTAVAIVAAVLLSAAGFAVLGWGIFQFSRSVDDLARLGGFIGGTVGPIWAAAGLLLIYIAFLGQQRQIYLQEDDLSLNRAELANNRAELRNQNEQLSLQRSEMEHQNVTLRRQSFENSFYQLLRFLRDLCANLAAAPAGGTAWIGEAAFREAVNELHNRLGIEHIPPLRPEKETAFVTSVMADVCLSERSDFGAYFRTLYHLIRLVERAGLPDEAMYFRLIRAQMSNNEQVLLYVNCLSSHPRMKELTERHAVLKGVRIPSRLEKYKERFAPGAFGP